VWFTILKALDIRYTGVGGEKMIGKNRDLGFRDKVLGVLVCAILVLSTVFLLSTPKATAAPDVWTEETDTDFQDSFSAGFLVDKVVLKGTGAPAYIELDKSSTWHNMTSGIAPPPREDFGFAFDSKYNRAILFGGVIAPTLTYYNDTWAYYYNNNTWIEIFDDGAPGSPEPRMGCGMAYDSTDQVVVLYGGYSIFTGFLFDTWEFDVDTNTWTKYKPPTSPSIENIAMVYDSVADRMILAGSYGIDPGTFETWAYDAGSHSWVNRAPSSQPSSRFGHAMAFVGSLTVLQGGRPTVLDPMAEWPDDYGKYSYAANTWTVKNYGGSATPPRPSQKVSHAIARFFNGVASVYGEPNFPLLIWQHFNLTPPHGDNSWVDITLESGLPLPSKAGIEMVWDSYNEIMIQFGGRIAPSASATPADYLNETWVFGAGYATSGFYVSKANDEYYYDAGCPYAEWANIYWNKTPAQQPAGTKLKFHLQSGNVSDPGLPDPDRTAFVGPNNDPGAYYETFGQTITGEHLHNRYIRYKAVFDGIIPASPEFDDISITYSCEGPPYIKSTDPADDEGNVPLWKNITIEFSEAMDTGTVTWTFSDPGISWLPDQWSPDDKILYLEHTDPFDECGEYTVTVTAGKDMDGFDLVPNPTVPNPWNFTALCIKPWIVDTHPANNEINVPWAENIIVTFSEPMIHTSIDWSVFPWIPPKADYTVEWGNSNTTLFLNHTNPFQECTPYDGFIIKAKDLKGNSLDPTKGVPNPWKFVTYCEQPFVAFRDPEHATTGVPVDKNIVITFSEEMATGTVTWYVAMDGYDNPPIDLGWGQSWDPSNTVLNISHSTLFDENQIYCVNVTYGEDLFANTLNRNASLARWCFTTTAVGPWIVNTDPYNGETGVEPDRNIVVTFSEPINTGTFSWTINPPVGGTWTKKWVMGNTRVYINHTTQFAMTMNYTVTITNAQDSDSNPLDPGKGKPNPWWFITGVGKPRNLRIERSPPSNIIIKWDAVSGADQYNVYESQNRFTPWPWTPIDTVFPPTTQSTDVGALTDGLDHFYIVRAYKGEEGGNSTMGAKTELSFTQSGNPMLTDINWLSLPYNTIYTKASDIANELGSGKIRTVGKWNPAKQKAITYTYAKGKWRGADFTISPGEGVFIAGLQTDFDWIVTGTDSARTLSFLYYPKHTENIYWISIPYTGIYNSASSIVIDIEGSLLVNPNYVIEVGKWNPATQTSLKYYWDGGAWTGTDFTIDPGDGIYITIKASFAWPIKLITPEVP